MILPLKRDKRGTYGDAVLEKLSEKLTNEFSIECYYEQKTTSKAIFEIGLIVTMIISPEML